MIGLVFSNVTHMSCFFILILKIINSLYVWSKYQSLYERIFDWSIVKRQGLCCWVDVDIGGGM